MNKKGFTLIELLVVIAIIGLLSTLAIVALGQAKVKARDSKRLADLTQVQKALELFYDDQNSYPVGSGVVLGTINAVCLNDQGWQATGCGGTLYMAQVPKDPGSNSYTYTAGANTYTITATLEGKIQNFSAGITITPNGMQD